MAAPKQKRIAQMNAEIGRDAIYDVSTEMC